MDYISAPELGTYPRDTIEEYQRAWDEALAAEELPFDGVASLLYDKLGCSGSVSIGDAKFKNPIPLMALGEAAVTFGGHWWKNLIPSTGSSPNKALTVSPHFISLTSQLRLHTKR